MPKFDRVAYNRKYQREKFFDYKLQLSKKSDKDIINKLMSVPSKKRYIAELIRKDIERED